MMSLHRITARSFVELDTLLCLVGEEKNSARARGRLAMTCRYKSICMETLSGNRTWSPSRGRAAETRGKRGRGNRRPCLSYALGTSKRTVCGENEALWVLWWWRQCMWVDMDPCRFHQWMTRHVLQTRFRVTVNRARTQWRQSTKPHCGEMWRVGHVCVWWTQNHFKKPSWFSMCLQCLPSQCTLLHGLHSVPLSLFGPCGGQPVGTKSFPVNNQ